MKPFLLTLLVASCFTSCASRGGQTPVAASCVVPASICQPTTDGGTGGGAQTCGLCPPTQLLEWLRETGCTLADLPCANGGTIYLDDHNFWCCTECPDDCAQE